ncbi:MAG: peptidase M17 [Myxococcales bacterium]|nr:peptidase M17 [Myxococcales bacterium]
MIIHFTAPDLGRLDELRTEAICLPIFEDQRPVRGALSLVDWRLCGGISRLLESGILTGKWGERALIPSRGKLSMEKIFLYGAGPRGELDDGRFRSAVAEMFRTLRLAKVRESAWSLPGVPSLPTAARAMELFLAESRDEDFQDELILIESSSSQRKMIPVLERERRKAQAERV